jgi:hypothetical protein
VGDGETERWLEFGHTLEASLYIEVVVNTTTQHLLKVGVFDLPRRATQPPWFKGHRKS